MNVWIEGATLTGKTTRLIDYFQQWSNLNNPQKALVFAPTRRNRSKLATLIEKRLTGTVPINCQTPLGFFEDEIRLFWPLISDLLQIKAQFPLKLRPETEQELATKLWQNHLKKAQLPGIVKQDRLIRHILDILQLVTASGIKIKDISSRLNQGMKIYSPLTDAEIREIWSEWEKMIDIWLNWCLNKGFLTYSVIYYLYDQYLLPHTTYQEYLSNKYNAIFADDSDEYPAIVRHFFQFFLTNNNFGVFTYNPEGKIRLGLNAAPDYLQDLEKQCQKEILPEKENETAIAVKLLTNFAELQLLPSNITQIKAITRSSLLKKVSQFIINSVKKGVITPSEIAIIAPGLDDIARYTLIELLAAKGINITPLNEQRPLVSFAHIRALLTLLCLIYPDLGDLAAPDYVAEMLTLFSLKPSQKRHLTPIIDPIRAGLIIDHCYQFHPPHLLELEISFPRWDRLGYKASRAYNQICQWLTKITKAIPETPVTTVLNQAIKDFYFQGNHFSAAEISALRVLMETAQHYGQINQRYALGGVRDFVQLLHRGAITANERPQGILGNCQNSIALATIFQYRQERGQHRWHFWLDANSRLWEKGGAATLFGSAIFSPTWSGKPLTLEEETRENQERLIRIVKDLLSRKGEKVYLCYSELDINGSEQISGLSPLIYASEEVEFSPSKK